MGITNYIDNLKVLDETTNVVGSPYLSQERALTRIPLGTALIYACQAKSDSSGSPHRFPNQNAPKSLTEAKSFQLSIEAFSKKGNMSR